MNYTKTFKCFPKSYSIGLSGSTKCLFIKTIEEGKPCLFVLPLSKVGVSYFPIPKNVKDEESYISDIRDEIPKNLKIENGVVSVMGQFDLVENIETVMNKNKSNNSEIVEILDGFQHIPYSTFKIKGEVEEKENEFRKTVFFHNIEEWSNLAIEEKKHDMYDDVIYFDIETGVTGSMFTFSETEDITFISFTVSGVTKVFTILPLDEAIKYSKTNNVKIEDVDAYTQFDTLYEMLDEFIKIMIKFSKVVSYNGYMFDIPFIIDVILRLDPDYFSKLSKYDGRTIFVDFKYVSTSFGFKRTKFISVPGMEHVDLLPIVQRLFPTWKNHKLDTAANELISKGKSGFPIRKYIKMISEWKEAKKANISLDDSTLELLIKSMEYSRVDAFILEECYKALEYYENIAVERAGLTSETFSTFNEIDGILIKFNKSILFNPKSTGKAKLNLEKGIYPKTNVLILNDIVMDCILSEKFKEYMLILTSKNMSLESYGNFFNQLLKYPELFDWEKYKEMVKTLIDYENKENDFNLEIVGFYGVYIYVSGDLKGEEYYTQKSYYSYEAIYVPTGASWISINVDTDNDGSILYSLNKKGLAKITRSLPSRIDDLISEEIVNLSKQKLNGEKLEFITDIGSAKALKGRIYKKGSPLKMDKFINHFNVNRLSSDDKISFLTDEEKEYLDAGGAFVTVKYIHTTKGKIRIYYPYSAKSMSLQAYADILKDHLTTIKKSLKIK